MQDFAGFWTLATGPRVKALPNRDIGTARTRSYGVDAAIMHIQRHERGIHIV